MKDRFKFRAWSIKNKAYIYNIQDVGCDFSIKCNEDCFGDFLDAEHYIDGKYQQAYIIEQSTGLKDKKGNLIYEGDIVAEEYYDGKLSRPAVVKYGEFNCSCCSGVYGWYFDDGDIREVENYVILGNIHENGNLIEGIYESN